jgi:uncharacterized protein YhdP
VRRRPTAGWSATVASEELAGELSYRKDAGGRLVARLARFRTPEDYPGAPARASLEPKDLPTMDLVAERFTWRGKELGRVQIEGSRAGATCSFALKSAASITVQSTDP